MLRFFPEKTKIIFLDLEYYVPAEDRQRKTPSGMIFSPVLPGHKILGGTFLTYYPMQDRVGKRFDIWEWKQGSEKDVLLNVFQLFQKEWKSIEAKHQAASLMLSGIGISHSDVPALVTKLSSSAVADPARIYDLLCGCRQIDLTTATCCQFSFNHSYFTYPKSKSALYQKYLNGKKLDSGKSVWNLYDNKNFDAIEKRSREEINDALAIYKAMFDIKRQNDRSIKRLRLLDKEAEKNSLVK